MSHDVEVRYIEVRTWPHRADVIAIDGLDVLATWPLEYPLPDGFEDSPIFQIEASWEQRATAALRALEKDQDLLRVHFGLGATVEIQLAALRSPQARCESVLNEHGFTFEDVDLHRLPALVQRLQAMTENDLWELLADWHDISVLRYPAGWSRAHLEQVPVIAHLHPDQANLYQQRSGGDPHIAFRNFREDVDVPADEIAFNTILRWVLVSRTEFADAEQRPPAAVAHLLS